jgi:hypothetical protein
MIGSSFLPGQAVAAEYLGRSVACIILTIG